MGHNGKPKAQERELSLQPVAQWLTKNLGRKVQLVSFPYPKKLPSSPKVLLLENLRFTPEEKANTPKFAKLLASYADVYCNNAFASSHRKHASIVGVPKYIKGYAGITLQQESKMLGKVIKNTPRPFVGVLGFAKIHDKVKIMEKILTKADKVLVGGAVVFTFFKAQGLEVGKSLVDTESIALAKKMLRTYKNKIVLPTDIVIIQQGKIRTVASSKMPKNGMGMDIGTDSVGHFYKIAADAKLVFWNGPLGKFEDKPFDAATNQFAKQISSTPTIVGGGDTAAAIRKSGYAANMSHISTGGGASLEFISQGTLPGIKAITR